MWIPQALPRPMTWVSPMRAPLDLALAGVAPQVRGHLVDVGDAGGAERMTLGEQTARHVDRNPPPERHIAVVDQPSRVAVPAQPEVLVVEDLGGGEAVVEFDEIHILRPEAGHLVGRGRSLAGAGVDIRHDQVAFLPGVGGEHRGAHLDGAVHEAEFAHLLLGSDHGGGRAVHVHRTHELGVGVGDHLGIHHRLERGLDLVHGLGIHGGVVVVLHRHLGELLEGGAVLARVLHAGLGEYRGHGAGTQQALLGDAAAATAAAKQAPAHLLDTDGQDDVVEVGLDRRPGLAERRGAGGAGIGHVDHGDPGLADLLQDALADHAARLAQVSAVQRLHVLDGQSAVVERKERRLRTELRDGFFGKPSEFDHVHTDYVGICHGGAPRRFEV